MKVRTAGTVALAALLTASTVNHVRNPAFYYSVVPRSLCTDRNGRFGVLTRSEWVALTAVPEGILAVGLLVPQTRRAAATATAAMFTLFTAGHVAAVRHAFGVRGSAAARTIHAVRLPLQLPLILWAWSLRRA